MLPQNCFVIESGCHSAHIQPRLRNGRFYAVLPKASETIVKTDRTGQEQLFVFEKGEHWAISNSFLLLASHAAKSHRLSLYPPALIGFHLKGGRHVGEQLVSHKTAIQDIRMVPATHDLVIDRATNSLSEIRRSFMTEFSLKDASYEEVLLRFLQRRADLLAALSGHAGALIYRSIGWAAITKSLTFNSD